MASSRLIAGTLLIFGLLVVATGATRTQNNELEARVDTLEKRVKKLESILFATTRLSAYEAKRELERAKEVLRDSEGLFSRGFIAAARIDQDRFRVREAQRQLDLAIARSDQQLIVSDIEVLQAKRELQMAADTLDHTQRLFNRSYVSQRQLEIAKKEVEQFQKRLDLAESKAKAARDLKFIDEEEGKAISEKPGEKKPEDKLPQDKK